jgi:Flp pilus assembly protein TadD
MGKKASILLTALILFTGCMATVPPVNFEDRMLSLDLIDQGTRHLRAGELAEAKASFLMSFELQASAVAVDGLGCVAFRAGDYPAAEQYFWRALEMDEDYSNSLGNLALLYDVQKQPLRAKKFYKQAIAEDPKNIRFRNNLAVLLLENDSGDRITRAIAREELLKAASIVKHSIIEDNIARTK